MDDEQSDRLFQLADAILAVARHIEAAKPSEPDGATPAHAAVLRHLDRTPGATVGEVALATQTLSSNVSRAIRGLEEAGYVRREPDPDDARRVRLYPTEEAASNLRHLRTRWSELLDGVLQDPAEIESTTNTLRLIESFLTRPPDGPTPRAASPEA